jgi:hypothetical protein
VDHETLASENKFYLTKQMDDLVSHWSTIVTINVPVVYMERDVMILMRASSITRAIGRGGP